MLETLAGTVLVQWLMCPVCVAVYAPLKYTVENDGRDSTFDLADADAPETLIGSTFLV